MRTSFYALIAMGCLGGPAALPEIIPTLTPVGLFTSATVDPNSVATPVEDTTLQGSGYPHKVIARPDVYSGIRIKPAGLYVTVGAGNGSIRRDGIASVTGYLVSASGTVQVANAGPEMLSPSTVATGWPFQIAHPGNTQDGWADAYFQVIPNSGYPRLLGPYRLHFEGTARNPIDIYVDADTGHDSNPGTSGSPVQTIAKATSLVSDGSGANAAGTVWVNDQASNPYLWDYDLTSTKRHNPCVIEIRSLHGGQHVVDRTGVTSLDTMNGTINAVQGVTYNISRVVHYNSNFTMNRIPYFSQPGSSDAYNYEYTMFHVNCRHYDSSMDTDQAYVSGFDYLFDQSGAKALGLKATAGLINCTGQIGPMAGVDLCVGAVYNFAWDARYMPAYTAGMTSFGFKGTQNRTAENLVANAPAAISAIYRDAENDRTDFIFSGEPFAGVASISVVSGKTTVSTFKSDGVTPLAHNFNNTASYGQKVMFTGTMPAGGPLQGVWYQIATVTAGNVFTINFGTVTASATSLAFTAVTLNNSSNTGFINPTTGIGFGAAIKTGASKYSVQPNDWVTATCNTADYSGIGNSHIGMFDYLLATRPDFATGGYLHPVAMTIAAAPATTSGAILTSAGTLTTITGVTLASASNANGRLCTLSGPPSSTIAAGMTLHVGSRTFMVCRGCNMTAVTGANGVPAYSFYVRWDGGADLSVAAAGFSVTWDKHGLGVNSNVHIGGTKYTLTSASGGTTLTFSALPSGFTSGASVLIAGVQTTISSVSGNTVVVSPAVPTATSGSSVRVGGSLLTVASVSGNTATLVSAPSADITTPSSYEHYLPQGFYQLRVREFYRDIYGNLLSTPSASPTPTIGSGSAAPGDLIAILNGRQHSDAFQNQAQNGPNIMENVFLQHDRIVGYTIQPQQILPSTTAYSLGTATVDSATGKTVTLSGLTTYNLASAAAAPSLCVKNANSGAPLPTFDVAFGGTPASGSAVMYPFFNTERDYNFRVFFLGTYGGLGSFRLVFIKSNGGGSYKVRVIDDMGLTNGTTFVVAAGDKMQQIVPLTQGCPFGLNNGFTTAGTTPLFAQSRRIVSMDMYNPTTLTIDEAFWPITGSGLENLSTTPANVTIALVIKDVLFQTCITCSQLPGQTDTPNFHSSNLYFNWAQGIYTVNYGWTNSTLGQGISQAGLCNKGSVTTGLFVLDTVFGGTARPSFDAFCDFRDVTIDNCVSGPIINNATCYSRDPLCIINSGGTRPPAFSGFIDSRLPGGGYAANLYYNTDQMGSGGVPTPVFDYTTWKPQAGTILRTCTPAHKFDNDNQAYPAIGALVGAKPTAF